MSANKEINPLLQDLYVSLTVKATNLSAHKSVIIDLIELVNIVISTLQCVHENEQGHV